MTRFSAIDLFCGAGGMSLGFQRAGFAILAGNDSDSVAGRTFANSHPEAKFISGEIQNLSVADLLSVTGLKRGELDCLIGGPPCQGFSVYNHQRGMHDTRSHLFKEYLRIVAGLNPRWIVMENVTGLLSIEGGAIVREICDQFEQLGYSIEWKILKTEEFGIPQERRRVVFIGTREDTKIRFPTATHGLKKLPFVTVKDAILDLPILQNGEELVKCKYPMKAKSKYQKLLRQDSCFVQNHRSPRLSKVNLDRIKYIPPGGSWRDLPFELLPEGMKKAKRSDHTKRYGRMELAGLSCTILTKCDIHWGAYIHPTQDRAISVREAARLQSFPDDVLFEGGLTDQFVQVGNAVPPLLAQKIAESILLADRERKANSRQFKETARSSHANL